MNALQYSPPKTPRFALYAPRPAGLLAGLCLLGLLFAGPVRGAESGTQVSVVGGLTRAYTLHPGEQFEGRLTLRNDGDVAADVRLSQTDYQFTATGEVHYGQPASLPRSNAGWIKLTPTQVTIPPHESTTVFFLIAVPDPLPLPGTFWSVVMVEPLSAGELDPATAASGSVSVGIRMVHRYAVQLVTTIGDGTAEIGFSNATIAPQADGPVLTIDLANRGELWLNPTSWAELFDAAGTNCGRFPGNRMRLFPGCSGRFRIPLGALPPGNYTALVVADAGVEPVFGTQVVVTIP